MENKHNWKIILLLWNENEYILIIEILFFEEELDRMRKKIKKWKQRNEEENDWFEKSNRFE